LKRLAKFVLSRARFFDPQSQQGQPDASKLPGQANQLKSGEARNLPSATNSSID
jgi:hypothetical protein